MARSTRSKTAIKEEEEQRQGEQAGETEALPPQPPTSLLSLPDDLLLLVYEELYEDVYGAEPMSPPVSEILVNKRIFNLIRPLWFSRLSISEHEADLRFSSLLLDHSRRGYIRTLSLTFEPTLAHLTRAALSQLHSLSTIIITFPDYPSHKSEKVLLKAMKEVKTIKHFTFVYAGVPRNESYFVARCWKLARSGSGSVDVLQSKERIFRYTSSSGLETLQFSQDFRTGFPNIRWDNLVSLKLDNSRDVTPRARDLLKSLEGAVSQGNHGTSVPLKHLSLNFPILSDDSDDEEDPDDWGSGNLRDLFRLLSRTNLEQIELNNVDWIPCISGENNFENLPLLLRTFPSLTQVHFSGPIFFGDEEITFEDISKLETVKMSFRYPILGTLLAYLQTTNVKIFAYRGSNEQRELRWTRFTTEETFDRDCWTLS